MSTAAAEIYRRKGFLERQSLLEEEANDDNNNEQHCSEDDFTLLHSSQSTGVVETTHPPQGSSNQQGSLCKYLLVLLFFILVTLLWGLHVTNNQQLLEHSNSPLTTTVSPSTSQDYLAPETTEATATLGNVMPDLSGLAKNMDAASSPVLDDHQVVVVESATLDIPTMTTTVQSPQPPPQSYSDDPSLEEIYLDIQANTTTFQIETTRPVCTTGDCTYRLYLSGTALESTYFYYSQLSHRYESSVTLDIPGTYNLAIVLETKRNCSTYSGTFEEDYALEYNVSKGGFQLGERITTPNASFTLDSELTTMIPSVEEYGTLPRCQYRGDDITRNRFQWTPASTLKSHGYTDKDTLLLREEMIDSHHDLWHFYYQKDIHGSEFYWVGNDQTPHVIQPFPMKAIYHGKNCRQPLITPLDMKELFRQHNVTQLAIFGTSRVVHVGGMINNYLKSEYAISQFTRGWLQSFHNNATETLKQMKDHFDGTKMCVGEPTNSTAVFIISHGIWEARAQSPESLFTFTDAEEEIRWIQKRCENFKYKIVLMTNPSAHPFAVYSDPRFVKRPYFRLFYSLANSRLQYVKWEWTRLAHKYNLPVVDLFGASLARRDMTADNIHYQLFDKNLEIVTFGPDKKQVGNEVTFVFAQLALAGIQEAFVLPPPQQRVVHVEGVPPSKLWTLDEFKQRYDVSSTKNNDAGGSGTTLAKEIEHNTTVAIKSVKDNGLYEIQALLACQNHPNIIGGYGAMVDPVASPDENLLVMESAERFKSSLRSGETIGLVAASALSLQQAIYNITTAVEYIHQQNWVHRDLFAYNIVLANDGHTLKISNFACARLVSLTFPVIGDIRQLAVTFIELSFGMTYRFVNQGDVLPYLSASECPLASFLSSMIISSTPGNATELSATSLLSHEYLVNAPTDACEAWRLEASKMLIAKYPHEE